MPQVCAVGRISGSDLRAGLSRQGRNIQQPARVHKSRCLSSPQQLPGHSTKETPACTRTVSSPALKVHTHPLLGRKSYSQRRCKSVSAQYRDNSVFVVQCGSRSQSTRSILLNLRSGRVRIAANSCDSMLQLWRANCMAATDLVVLTDLSSLLDKAMQ